jgi:hypothetical protein
MKPDHPQERRDVIIVSGLPRSGTSMMMKMLMAGGVPLLTDGVRQANDDNPEGYFEFERVKQLDKGDVGWLDLAEGHAVKVISALLGHLPGSHAYRVIFMQRNLREILASQDKMLANLGQRQRSVDDLQLHAVFEKHLAQVKSLLSQRSNMRVLYVDHRAVLDDAAQAAQRVQAFLEQPLDCVAMARAVSARLYRNRS